MNAILRELARDARQTPAEIASTTGMTESEVTTLIGEAEARGIILGWGARINWEALGLPIVYAVIEVTVEPQENVGYNAVARRIGDRLATMPGVKGTTTRVLMRRYKEGGVMLEREDGGNRQKVVF